MNSITDVNPAECRTRPLPRVQPRPVPDPVTVRCGRARKAAVAGAAWIDPSRQGTGPPHASRSVPAFPRLADAVPFGRRNPDADTPDIPDAAVQRRARAARAN